MFRLPENPDLFLWLPALWGISGALYWVSFHTDFALSSKRKKRGSEVGLLYVFSDIAKVFGPITGAFLITFFNFDMVFGITSVALLLASTPLFFSKDIKLMPKISFKKEVDNFDRNIFVALFGGGMNGAIGGIFWPLFMFIILESYISIGWIHSLGILLALISSVLVGRIFDRHGKGALLKVSSVGHSLLWIVRMGMAQLWHFAGQALISGTITRGREISVEAAYYNSAAKSTDIPQFTVFRELSIHSGFIFILILIWIMFLFVETIQYTFLLAALAVLLSITMLKIRS